MLEWLKNKLAPDYESYKEKAHKYDRIIAKEKIEKQKENLGKFKVGCRVQARPNTFNAGAKGTVQYIEPGLFDVKIWVRRDGSSSGVYYHLEELNLLEE